MEKSSGQDQVINPSQETMFECFPEDIFLDKKFIENFLCPICNGISRNPIQDQDGHIFGRRCIEHWLKQSKTCPISRTPLQSQQLCQISLPFKNKYNETQVQCFNKLKGCEWTGKLENIFDHIKNQCICAYEKCKFEKCNEYKMRKDMEEHYKVCPRRIIKCCFCEKLLQYCSLQFHLEVCENNPELIINCSICQQQIKKKDQQSHEKFSQQIHIKNLALMAEQHSQQITDLSLQLQQERMKSQMLELLVFQEISPYPWLMRQNLCLSTPMDSLFYSNISYLETVQQYLNQTLSKYTPHIIFMKLCYSSSVQGFSEQEFQNTCPNDPTLLIIQNEFHDIFGGFTMISWKKPFSKDECLFDADAFVFKLNKNTSKKFESTRGQPAIQMSSIKTNKRKPLFGKESERAFIVNLENGRCGANRRAEQYGILNFDLFDLTKKYDIHSDKKNDYVWFTIDSMELYQIKLSMQQTISHAPLFQQK